MSNSRKIAVCQMHVADNKQANIVKADSYIQQAAQAGCQIVILPEMFNCPYVPALFPQYAEQYPDGETIAWLARTAAQAGIIIVGGSIPEQADDHKTYNTSFVFDETGNLVARHRKIHLVDYYGVVPPVLESATIAPGKDMTVVQAGGMNLGVAICYDIRFPELSRAMVLNGADILIFPAAFGMSTGSVHWELLMRMRAVDNQAFVIGAAPARTSGAVRQNWGHSMIVDPWGDIVAALDEQEGILITEIDLDKITAVRDKMPLLQHRRPDIYSRLRE